MQTAEQLRKEYFDKSFRTFEVYEALRENMADREELRQVVYDYNKFKSLADVFYNVTRRNEFRA